jgi:hypothetical protein
MSNIVIPRQQGDMYQSHFFWLNACKLFLPQSCAAKIEWEATTTGFDDIVLHYDPPKFDEGDKIIIENYQVKFHVDQARGFTCDALIDPTFIGTTRETILGRLYNLYKADPSVSRNARFFIINTWGIDSSDEFRFLIGNGGAIRLQKLFEGDTSGKFAAIRKKWREHLGITSDVELKEVLRPLRIKHSYPDLNGICDELNFRLHHAGLKPLEANKRASGYAELIQRLHAEGKRVFTREELLEICDKEGLVLKKEEFVNEDYIVGVRSFSKGAESLELYVNDLLCLLHMFSGRFLHEEESWENVRTLLQEFAKKSLDLRKPLLIRLDTHLSAAFCFGYYLDLKSGVNKAIVQKTLAGRIIWKPEPSNSEETNADNWTWENKILFPNQEDIVVAISVTHDIYLGVETFVKNNLAESGVLLHAAIKPQPGFTAVKNANHIIAAVSELIAKIKDLHVQQGRKGKIHFFMAAPNAFAFFLGQQSKSLGKIILYEYDFENVRTGSYHTGISLPN